MNNKLFLAAARRAGNEAVLLELPADTPRGAVHISRLVLLGVLRANAASLRKVRLGDEVYTDATLNEFVKAVPHVCDFAVSVSCWSPARALAVLRNEPPYAAVRLHKLRLYCEHDGTVTTAMVAAAAHPSLRKLQVSSHFYSPACTHAVVDAAVSLGLCELTLNVRVQLAAAVTALPRLLQSEALTALHIRSGRWRLRQ